ncbi:MAG TPA: SHOCT domain-containing protein [Woeseiaceae bacterium]|nr:SHOCT domain-containing protein [Woeseiaceae bacterium]
MGGMWFFWILGIALVVLVAWGVARPSSGRAAGKRESAEERLKRRYAEGEIDKEEYEDRLKDLRR